MQTTPAPDLIAAHALAYAPCGFALSALEAEPESADYGACALVLNGLRIRFRVAKTTPIKTGHSRLPAVDQRDQPSFHLRKSLLNQDRIEKRDGEPKVFGWVSGDEQVLLREHGII